MSSFKAEKLPVSQDRKREQADYLGFSLISLHLKKIGKESKLTIWVSHCFREKNKEDCISIVTSLLSRLRNCLFLKNIIIFKKGRKRDQADYLCFSLF